MNSELTITENISGPVAEKRQCHEWTHRTAGKSDVVIIIFRFTNRVNKVTSINIINQNFIDIGVAVLILLADFTDSHFMPADDDVKGSR